MGSESYLDWNFSWLTRPWPHAVDYTRLRRRMPKNCSLISISLDPDCPIFHSRIVASDLQHVLSDRPTYQV